MAISTARRPLPAVVFLLVLSVLTAIVWWRVLHRSDSSASGSSNPPTPAATCASAGATPITLPSARTVKVTVYNGAGVAQLAAKVTAELKARGFQTGAPDDRPSYTGVAEVEYGKSGKAAATLVAYYLPGSRLVAITRGDSSVDVVLGSAYKSLATQASVNKAVAAAKQPCK